MARNKFEQEGLRSHPLERQTEKAVRLEDYCESSRFQARELAERLSLFAQLLAKYNSDSKRVTLFYNGNTIEIVRISAGQLMLTLLDTDNRSGANRLRCSFLLERHFYTHWMVSKSFAGHVYPHNLDPDFRGLDRLYAQAFRTIGTAIVQDVRVHPELVKLHTQLREAKITAMRTAPGRAEQRLLLQIQHIKESIYDTWYPSIAGRRDH